MIKDIIMMAGGLVAAAECAKRYLENKSNLRNSSILKGLLEINSKPFIDIKEMGK